MVTSKTILLLGAGGPAGANFLGCLRKWQEPGDPYWYVIGTDANPYHLELSKAHKRFLVKPIGDLLFDRLDHIIKKYEVDLVWPQPDFLVDLLSSYTRNWPIFLPSHKVIRLCQDKLSTARALAPYNLSAPAGWAATSESLQCLAGEMLLRGDGNGVLWMRCRHGAGSKASTKIYRVGQVASWLSYCMDREGLPVSSLMLQPFLPGPEYAWQSVWYEGKLICSAARQRLEYFGGAQSITGQTSSPSVAVSVHRQDVNKAGATAVKAVCGDESRHGVFCVDMKTDHTGAIRVTEVNAGRFFTTSNFFAEAGCNMPRVACMLALGLDPGPQEQFDAVPEGLYWIRQPDMGYTLCKNVPEFQEP